MLVSPQPPPKEQPRPEKSVRVKDRRRLAQLSGLVLEPYVLENILGTGAYSVVYRSSIRAEDLMFKTRVAIKCLSKNHLSQSQLAAQNRESSFLKTLSKNASNDAASARIVQYCSEYEVGDTRFIVMELCEGSLFTLAVQGIRLEFGDRFIKEILEGVAFMHRNGIYHRDLKCENILISSDYSIKISDFGLATSMAFSTEFGCGSLRYLSPENLDCDHKGVPYDCLKNDIWSCGIIIINILTRKNPWASPHKNDENFRGHILERRPIFADAKRRPDAVLFAEMIKVLSMEYFDLAHHIEE